MDQLTLNLNAFLGVPTPVTYIEKFLGLTGWKQTLLEPPEYIGWYRTWNENGAHQRRWWDGKQWSVPVKLGSTWAVAEDYREMRSRYDSGGVVWCGLLKPHPAGYTQPLQVSPRVTRWRAAHVTV